MGELVLVPGLRLGVVVLMNVGNGLVPAVVPQVSRLASDVARFLLDLPQPHRRLSSLRFYAALDVTLKALTLYQGWSLVQLLRGSAGRGRSTLSLASLVEVVLGVMTFLRLPRMADAPWSLIRVYVPDITSALAVFFGASLLKSVVWLLSLLRSQ